MCTDPCETAKFLLNQIAFFPLFLFRIRYGPIWAAETQKIETSDCLAPELPCVDCSRQFLTAESHVTNESTNHTTAVTDSQTSNKEESVRSQINSYTRANCAPVHGLINLALAMRQRRDFIGPRSPLTPLRLSGKNLQRFSLVKRLCRFNEMVIALNV